MLKDIPDEFINFVLERISSYSIPLISKDGFLGSGTLVRTHSTFGILTARHVLSRQEPPIIFSNSFDDVLLLPLGEGLNCFCLPHPLLEEIVIGEPVTDQEGPDLSFIKIAPCDQLETLKAKKAFWNIEANKTEKLDRILASTGMCMFTGYPQLKCDFTKVDNNFHIYAYLLGTVGFLHQDLRYEDGEFDFLESRAKIEPAGAVPVTIKGMSGGGIWAIDFSHKESDKSFQLTDMTLCGVAFYEQPIDDETNNIRGHFAKSIYNTVLEKIC